MSTRSGRRSRSSLWQTCGLSPTSRSPGANNDGTRTGTPDLRTSGLLVEITESSEQDRTKKLVGYAAAGIPVYAIPRPGPAPSSRFTAIQDTLRPGPRNGVGGGDDPGGRFCGTGDRPAIVRVDRRRGEPAASDVASSSGTLSAASSQARRTLPAVKEARGHRQDASPGDRAEQRQSGFG